MRTGHFIVFILLLCLGGCDSSKSTKVQFESPSGDSTVFADRVGDGISVNVVSRDGSSQELMKISRFSDFQVTWKGDNAVLIDNSDRGILLFEKNPGGKWVSRDPLMVSSSDGRFKCAVRWSSTASKEVIVDILKTTSTEEVKRIIKSIEIHDAVADLTSCATWRDDGVLLIQASKGTYKVERDNAGEWVLSGKR